MVDNDQSKANRLNFNEFEIIQIIRKGKLFKIYFAKRRKTGELFTFQEYNKKDILHKQLYQNLKCNYDLLCSLSHPFIIDFKSAITTEPKSLFYIYEYIPGGNLATHLKLLKTFTLEQSKFYAAHVIKAFEYLHSQNILYRDLRLKNLLLEKGGYLKLINFDMAKRLNHLNRTYSIIGRPKNLSPEIILNKGYGKPADWWTLGVLLFEMLVGKDPFRDKDPILVYQKIIIGRINFPKRIDKDAKMLIKQLLNPDEKLRYGCGKNGILDITYHRLYNDFDWKSFEAKQLNAPYIPSMKGSDDTIYYPTYEAVKKEDFLIVGDKDKEKDRDPFLDW